MQLIKFLPLTSEAPWHRYYKQKGMYSVKCPPGQYMKIKVVKVPHAMIPGCILDTLVYRYIEKDQQKDSMPWKAL